MATQGTRRSFSTNGSCADGCGWLAARHLHRERIRTPVANNPVKRAPSSAWSSGRRQRSSHRVCIAFGECASSRMHQCFPSVGFWCAIRPVLERIPSLGTKTMRPGAVQRCRVLSLVIPLRTACARAFALGERCRPSTLLRSLERRPGALAPILQTIEPDR